MKQVCRPGHQHVLSPTPTPIRRQRTCLTLGLKSITTPPTTLGQVEEILQSRCAAVTSSRDHVSWLPGRPRHEVKGRCRVLGPD